MFVGQRQTDWPQWLLLAEYKYSNQVHSSTRYSLFFMAHGFHPYTGVEIPQQAKNQSAQEFVDQLKKIEEQATKAMEKMQATMKRAYDAHKRPSEEFVAGNKVWLDATHLNINKLNKLKDKQVGPFEIVKKVRLAAYELKLPREY